jgi:AcrR family transcriptional regulator
VAAEKLTRETVIEQAIRLATDEGLAALTIRRLAGRLGVTPMALYWHFKNKDELLLALGDHFWGPVTADLRPQVAWHERLRRMVETLVARLREYPVAAELLQEIRKEECESFRRATNGALDLLIGAGFTLQEGYYVSTYLLEGVVSLVRCRPLGDSGISEQEEQEEAERRRLKRLRLESLPADQYPHIVEYARTMIDPPDVDHYFAFGVDLLMAGVERMAERGAAGPAAGRACPVRRP